MKLILCLFNYFPFGGLQRDFLRIARECLHRQHTVDVFTMQWQGEKEPGLNVIFAPASGWQNHTRCQQFTQQLQKHLQHEKYDAVIGFNKMPGLDIYYAADTCYQAKAHKQRSHWYRLTPRYRHLISYEQAVFAPTAKTEILLLSSAQQAEFHHFYGTPASRFHLLPPGISKDRMAPPHANEIRKKMRTEWKITENELLLLMVGSGFKTKGVDRSLFAFSALPNELKSRTRLFIIGDDTATPFIKQAKRLNCEKYITFLGGRHDVPDFLLAADLLLHPAYNENTGTVLLEALIAGLPVLTTDVCGYAHYVRDAKAGIVLNSPFQQAELNHTLMTMLNSLPKADWQANGLSFAHTADIYRLPQQAVHFIEQLCN